MNSCLGEYSATSMASSHEEPYEDTRANLLTQIRGSCVKIPDLKNLLSHWPADTHPQVEELEKHVQATLECIFTDPKDEYRLRKMKASQIGSLTAAWFPYASFEALCVLANIYVWLFAWDDETDSFEFSPLIHDLGSATAFRDQTISFVRQSLTRQNSEELTFTTTPRLISYFESAGAVIYESYNDDQIKRFMNEIIFFIEMCEEEHKSQQTDRLPTTEQYMQRRMGSSAVRVCLALTDFASGSVLPEDIILDDSIQIIWRETNIIISAMNDVLSIKKEIVQSQVDSLIPLLFLKCGSVQTALDQILRELSGSIGRFEAAERDILSRYSAATAETQEKIRHHVEACKMACTGNLDWSIVSGRYGIHSTSMKDGIHMVL
ncbi:terpenoid synthase [Xylaria digitata]|nr:terpenoid synthase [Xylaria digitata]